MTDPVNGDQGQPEAAEEKPDLSGVTTEQLRQELATRNDADLQAVEMLMQERGVSVRCHPQLIPAGPNMTQWLLDTSQCVLVKGQPGKGQ